MTCIELARQSPRRRDVPIQDRLSYTLHCIVKYFGMCTTIYLSLILASVSSWRLLNQPPRFFLTNAGLIRRATWRWLGFGRG